MKHIKTILVATLAGAIILTSCVPAKEFQALQDTNAKCQEEHEKLTTENEALGKKNSELDAQNRLSQSNIDRLLADSIARAVEFNSNKAELNSLKERHAELQKIQSGLMSGSKDETRKLLQQIQANQEELQEKTDAMKELERKLYQRKQGLDVLQGNLDSARAEFDRLKRAFEAQNTNLIELQNKLNAQDSIMRAMRDKVANALFGFEGKGLSVTMKDGKVYVSLEEKLMFKSGRYEIDDKGAAALKQLIPVLEQNKDISITVEGHTDNVPYKGTGELIDNWDLSVKRANTIVRILLTGSKIDPVRVTAAGRSQYLPIDKGSSADARQKNRRTEIILTPDMDKIMRLLGSN